MSTKLTAVTGPATELIHEIESQGFKSRGKPLVKFAPWQKLKGVILQMEKAVNSCWHLVAEVRGQIRLLQLKRKRATSKDLDSRDDSIDSGK